MSFSNRRDAARNLAALQEFRGSNLRGEYFNGWSEYRQGWLNEDEADRFKGDLRFIDYVVFSYATPIAWHRTGGRGWYVTQQKFSPTTTRHQSIVRQAVQSN